MNCDNLYKIFEKLDSHTEDYLGAVYINVFKEFPRSYRIYYDENEELQYIDATESFYDIRKKVKTKINSRKLLQNLIKQSDKENLDYFNKKLDRIDCNDHFLVNSIIACYSPHEYFIFGTDNGLYGGHNFLMNITLAEDGDMANFYEELLPSIQKIHGNIQHRGKVPTGASAEVKRKRDIEKTKRELEQAIKDENFELAVKLRDKIKEMEGGGNHDSK